LRCVAHRCPAEQQYIPLVLKPGQQMAEHRFTIKFKKYIWTRYWCNCSSDSDESNYGFV